ncbi:uncharacterized protein E0L32_007166 [Thyridium curvatum]|uniref:Inhibitor of growth protein N-terminal histone-binding domain-containing protein n=1 Tax=Thyridium curvatum TaxID=1093900 RepID=A0A507B4P9_9PEZI|nr:uncharacterized protein E0L32_007166 [Thyridium curvatum]TPX12051.1 hypothetical protein E0L32_007166 [Thyridium curvatum]
MEGPGADPGEGVSPRRKTSVEQAMPSFGAMSNPLDSLDLRADPDAQATVTDFLDFTEYLPADIMRSLTLIGQLDQTYIDASTNVHDLTTTWGRLPDMPPEERPAAVQVRADISQNLNRALSSRVYSHAEAVRMADNVSRHYNRAKIILGKLQTMMENYPTAEEQKSPVAARSPQMSRTPKISVRSEGGQRVRRQRVSRITVPGEVLAPYELDYESYTEESDDESEDDDSSPPRETPAAPPRIKLLKTPKTPKARMPRPTMTGQGFHPLSTSGVLAQLKPPPDDAVPGSADAPWLQLTAYELAKLRKRMKKNAQWTPSETMIARELKVLGRGVEAWRAAKKAAEDEDRPFENTLPVSVVDENGVSGPPLGALSIDAALAAEDKQNTNRGMKLNAAKKIKRESLAQLAAQEAEESARKLREAAKAIFAPNAAAVQAPGKTPGNVKPPRKRKRDSQPEADAEKPDMSESPAQKPQPKRPKTETPVPIPQPTLQAASSSAPAHETPVHPPLLSAGNPAVKPKSTTPVPVPIPPGQDHSNSKLSLSNSPASVASTPGSNTVTTTVPLKPPADTHIPPPIHSPKKSTTPILPPVRETRTREAARKEQARESLPPVKPPSRAATPAASEPLRRPMSRGKASSQEPPASLAVDRPRRASTARNTPVPEVRQPGKRPKRPAPGIISRTNSGGNSAVGKRKAAPKKKRGAPKKDKGQPDAEIEVEVDDEGNVIDPDEPRYCLCNGVSFGTMIQCDNTDVSSDRALPSISSSMA